MRNIFFVLLVAIMLVACAPRAISTSTTDAQVAVSKMVFVKELRSGLCFGVVSSANASGSGSSTSMSVTNIPCDKVEKFL